MAEEGKKPEEEKQDQKPEVKKQGLFSKKNLIILAVILLVLGGGAFFGIKKMAGPGEGEKSGESKKKESKEQVFSFSSLVVNVSGTNGSRYLKVTVGVQCPSEELMQELEARKIQLTDILNTIFSSKTLEQVIDVAERENTKREIRDKFNEILAEGKSEEQKKEGLVNNVFFSEYIAQ